MDAVFLKILNLSITGSWLILAVIFVRFLLKKAPKWVICLLWGLAALRLVCPVSVESVLSLIPSGETIPPDIALSHHPVIDSGIPVINDTVNPVILETFTPDPANSANPLQVVVFIARIIWLAGIAVMLLYALASWLKLKKTVSASLQVREGVMACDDIRTPFILGVIHPVIYIPSFMEGETLDHVIRHEKAHLARRDHWWKPLGFLILAVHWFNPLCWIAYILLCRDIESACDEKVIRDMDREDVAAYSQALLDCSRPRRMITACPLAFGEAGVKDRVKGILNYRKPSFWVLMSAVMVCIVLAVSMMTDPVSEKSLSRKLGTSLETAVLEHNRNLYTGDRFAAVDLDVMKVSESAGKTTVYAWVMYEEYVSDGTDVYDESGSHIPTVITFDTSSDNNDTAVYPVIEYWEPRDGSYYADDIRAKFPLPIRRRAFDVSNAAAQHENNLRKAREYFGTTGSSGLSHADHQVLTAVVREVREGTIIVEPVENAPELQSSRLFSIPVQTYLTFENGDIVEIRYDGTILETEPARLGTVWSVDIVGSAEEAIDILRKKYPEYFDLPAENGLDVYVWQMSEYQYSCALSADTGKVKTETELMDLKGTTFEEMRRILSTYGISREMITVIPFQNDISGYRYEIDDIYRKRVEKMLFGEIGVSSNVAFANWSEDAMLGDCLNPDKMAVSSQRHLPVYKFAAGEDLERFRETFRDTLTLDHGRDEMPSFEDACAKYDEDFFKDHTVVLAYVAAASGSFRYDVRDISMGGDSLCLNVIRTNDPEVYTADMSGWFVMAEISKEDLIGITAFDAVLYQ